LLRADLITFWETAREEGFPERTVYRLTDKGHQTAVEWLREMIAAPAAEFPEFPAAISVLPLLTPEDALVQMQLREKRLIEQIGRLDEELTTYTSMLPRLFLLESEYMRIAADAELKWVQSIINDLQSGQ